MTEKQRVLVTTCVAQATKFGLELGLQSTAFLTMPALTEKLTTKECWYLGLFALALSYAIGAPYQLGVLHKIGLCSDAVATAIYRSTHNDFLSAGGSIAAGWILTPFNCLDSSSFGLALAGHDGRFIAVDIAAKAITGFSSMFITNYALLRANDKIDLVEAR